MLPQPTIQRSAWKEYSGNFAITECSEVRLAFWGQIVCRKTKMVKSAPAQMAKRQTKNTTVECRLNLLSGTSVLALRTTSSATLARRVATEAIERRAW